MHPLPPPPLPFRFPNVGLYLDNSFFVSKQHCMGGGGMGKTPFKVKYRKSEGLQPGLFC